MFSRDFYNHCYPHSDPLVHSAARLSPESAEEIEQMQSTKLYRLPQPSKASPLSRLLAVSPASDPLRWHASAEIAGSGYVSGSMQSAATRAEEAAKAASPIEAIRRTSTAGAEVEVALTELKRSRTEKETSSTQVPIIRKYTRRRIRKSHTV